MPGTGEENQDPMGSSSRPKMFSYQSNSLPSTPLQEARDMHFHSRSPSPNNRRASQTPRSTSSEAIKMKTQHRSGPVIAECRFRTTQTSRRRMDYASDEILGPPPRTPKTFQSPAEKALLDERIVRLYECLLPSEPGQTRRQKILKKLRNIVAEGLPDRTFDVHVFGSSGNLLFTDKSDVDICITMRELETTCVLAELLAKSGMKSVKCVHAKAVPIVKIWDPELDLNCDLNLNNHVALKNTRLVKTYIKLDERVRPLGMIIKHWTKKRIINEASGGTLSSYTWTLLLINFLQTRNPPVLPCLALVDDDGRQRSDFRDDLETYRSFGAANQESVADLLFNFFRRYGYEVDFEQVVVSVREGRLLSKVKKGWNRANNNRLCVEEPFNIDRNLANTADGFAWRGLHLELRRAFDLIAEGRDIASVVFEQFEFPPDPRPAFERPPPPPKPVLTRSLSQSARGGRGSQSMRGNRQHQGRDPNRGPGSVNRRASSAAAFGHTQFPFMFSPAQFGLPGDYGFQGAQGPHTHQLTGVGVHDQLAQISRQLSAQEHELRQRLNQTQSTASGQMRSSAVNGLPLQQRPSSLNGFQSPDTLNLEETPATAPLVQPAYNYLQWNGSQMVPGWQSPARSQQGTETNPSSPILTPAATRRGLQRTPLVNSTTGPVRSQSQPARPGHPQNITYAHPAQAYMVAPNGPGDMQQQHQHHQMTHQFPQAGVVGQIQTPQGLYLVVDPSAAESSTPMEYLGYGFRDIAYINPPPTTQTNREPQDGGQAHRAWQASPAFFAQSQNSNAPSTTNPSRSGSPPIRTNDGWQEGMRSAPLPQEQWVGTGPVLPRPGDLGPPLVLNGSYRAAKALGDDLRGVTRPRRVSDSVGMTQQRTQAWRTSGSTFGTEHPYAWTQYDEATVSRRREHESAAESEASTRGSSRASFYDRQLSASPGRGANDTEGVNGLDNVGNVLESPISSPPTQQGISNVPRKAAANIVPLDLTASLPERFVDEGPLTATKTLSPVQETRSPSPVATRIAAEGRERLSVDKANGAFLSSSNRNLPYPPTPLRTALKENQNPHIESQDVATRTSVNANPWQQATKKGFKKNKSISDQQEAGKGKSRGEALPADVSQRKGG